MGLNKPITRLATFLLIIAATGASAQTGVNTNGLPVIYRSAKDREKDELRSISDVRVSAETARQLRTSFDLRWGSVSDKDYSELPSEAQVLLDQANLFADRVDFKTAREKLAEAASAAPNSIPLQFLLLKTSRRAAESSYGDESLMHFERASDALRRLTSNSRLSPEERLRVSRESERVREGIDTYRERDAKRLEDGFDFVLTIHDERRQRFESTFEKPIQPAAPTIDEILNPPPPLPPSDVAVPDSEIWAELNAPGLSLPVVKKLFTNALNQGGGFGPGGFGPGGPVEFGPVDPTASGFQAFDPATGTSFQPAPQPGGFPSPGGFPGNAGGFPGGVDGGASRGGK